ncbi:O-acyltransferase WSD1-like isoform X1 [Senna tora]|uniref:diacylglycerol O-acyltransferase n=1 Tax=Senna tora TaxID=362788 RepID=A0A834WQA0_9FABA|nr:O-acyltransferase WSD1-like isoform X1 [Senna tora]
MGSNERERERVVCEALSPAARLFHAPTFNCYVIAVIGTKTRIHPQSIKQGLSDTLLKHPRFTSNMVKKRGKCRWNPTTVKIDEHVIVADIDDEGNIEKADRFIEDYISNLTRTPLPTSKPLWEIHLLNLKTSEAEAVCVMRIHHSLGDGASLMSLLLAATRKTSDPHALPTLPRLNKANIITSSSDRNGRSGFIVWWFLLGVWGVMRLLWNTLVDLVMFVATVLFVRDSDTPLKGGRGVELSTKRFVFRNVSMDDVKLVKNAMKMTINDVLLGVTQAGLTRYLNRTKGVDGDGKERPKNKVKNIRLRATILVNLRPTAGIQVDGTSTFVLFMLNLMLFIICSRK